VPTGARNGRRVHRLPMTRLGGLGAVAFAVLVIVVEDVAILATSPELAAVTANVHTFAAIVNEKRGRKLLELRRS
jgi:hypothetical protein